MPARLTQEPLRPRSPARAFRNARARRLVALFASASRVKLVVDTDIGESCATNARFFATRFAVASSLTAAQARTPARAAAGQNCDDAWALSYVMSRGDVFDLRLVLSSSRNTTGRALLAAKLLALGGRPDVPVGIGTPTPLGEQMQGVGPEWPWIGSFTLKDYPGKVASDGLAALEAELAAASPSNPVWVLGLAPMGNLAAVLGSRPELALNARLVAMSGSISAGYDLRPPAVPEYNVAENVTAAQTVYGMTWGTPAVTAPIDTSAFFQVTGDAYRRFLEAAGGGGGRQEEPPLARVLLENYRVWFEHGGSSHGAMRPFSPANASSAMFDLQTAYMAACAAEGALFGWSNCTQHRYPALDSLPLRLVVDASGYTRVQPSAGAQAGEAQLFFAATNFSMPREAASDAMGAHVVDWIARGAWSLPAP